MRNADFGLQNGDQEHESRCDKLTAREKAQWPNEPTAPQDQGRNEEGMNVASPGVWGGSTCRSELVRVAGCRGRLTAYGLMILNPDVGTVNGAMQNVHHPDSFSEPIDVAVLEEGGLDIAVVANAKARFLTLVPLSTITLTPNVWGTAGGPLWQVEIGGIARAIAAIEDQGAVVVAWNSGERGRTQVVTLEDAVRATAGPSVMLPAAIVDQGIEVDAGAGVAYVALGKLGAAAVNLEFEITAGSWPLPAGGGADCARGSVDCWIRGHALGALSMNLARCHLREARMNLTRRTMLILMIGSLGPFSSCSQDVAGPDEQNGAAAHIPLFTKTTFDGCWNWYEKGNHLFKVTIAGGEVVSFEPLNRTAAHTTESADTCAIDSLDGLIAISSADRTANDRWVTVTKLRFDISDAPGKSCLEALAVGAISGRRSVELNDPDDHFLFPPQSSHQGLLVRCNSRQE